MSHPKQKSGLILLIVLGMLTLFSMLAITYVVFSSQSRSSNLALVRREFRGTPTPKLLNEAAMQLLRGSTDLNSVMWRQGLLGDLYGSGPSDPVVPGPFAEGPVLVFARAPRPLSPAPFNQTLRDNPARQAQVAWSLSLPITTASAEAPKLLRGMFLKIPLQWNESLPEQHDVWNGRVMTFLSGPLANVSFRIVRYLGEMADGNDPSLLVQQSLQYSIIIDLSSALDKIVTVGATTARLREWINSSTNGAELCYTDASLASPYSILINSSPLNSYGSGLNVDGKPLDPSVPATAQTSAAALGIPALQHVAGELPTGVFQSIATALLQNYSYTRGGNSGFLPTGDLDEPYDAADATDFHLAYRNAGAASGDDIIPSFHRPAVINAIYSAIVSDKGGSLSGITDVVDLFATIELLERACGRPLSFRVQNVPAALALPSGGRIIAQNPNFSGSNQGQFSAGFRTPQLDINWANWGTGNGEEQTKFENWVRWLIRGPWDVDTDSDGLNDANWVDINLPLMTSPEGRLLKVLAAYYVEDLGGRLNLNASGSAAQADPTFDMLAAADPQRYAFLNGNQLPQGLGYGTADISLRHLFGNLPGSLADYQRFIAERNGAPSVGPGQPGDDPISMAKQRHRLPNHSQNRLPGLPQSIFGRTGLGIDLFGNPIAYETSQLNQNVDDPYEAHVLTTPHLDRPITFAEWERLQRVYDGDRSTQPRRLQQLLASGGTTPLEQLELVRSVTPDSNSTIAASFGGTYAYDRYPAMQPNDRVFRRVSSFKEMIEKLAQDRFTDVSSAPSLGTYPIYNQDALAQLFPLEFSHNLPLDVNRPFGNGFDDDGDLLVDEPDEAAAGQYAEYAGLVYNPANFGANAIAESYAPGAGTGNGNLDYEFDSQPANIKPIFNGNQGRQLLARHLYCLAQLMLPDGYRFPNQPDLQVGLPYGDAVRARILAQWAVNVVDYRDMDANMTRFPYDADPLRRDSNSGLYWDPDQSNTANGVVWGREQPELLMTETFAFHDMRIYEKTPPPPAQPEWAQLRLPQGSLFLEFVCTASSDNLGSGLLQGQPGGNLYRFNPSTNRMELNLSAVTPVVPPFTQSFPVWRALLLQPDLEAKSSEPNYAAELQYNNPTTRATLQYQFARDAGLEWNTAKPGSAPDVNRVLWFANLEATNQNLALPQASWSDPRKRVFRNRSNNEVLLHGGQYLTVGPRRKTYFGQRDKSAEPDPVVNRPSLHRIELRNNWAQFWNEENHAGIWHPSDQPAEADADVPPPSNFIEPCVTMIATTDLPADWDPAIPRPRIGLNISEPTPDSGYYADANFEPNERLNTADTMADMKTGEDGFGSLPPDAYVDLINPAATSPHKPLDLRPGSLLRDGRWPIQSDMGDRPSVQSNPMQPTARPWSTAVLQRLANPDRPWHRILNPYITVDWTSIDLTVFNGEDIKPTNATLDRIPEDAAVHLGSVQKTGLAVNPTLDISNGLTQNQIEQNAGRTLYSYHPGHAPRSVQITASAAMEPSIFNYKTPLEYIDVPNSADSPENRLNNDSPPKNVGEFVTLGYLNSRFGLRGLNGGTAHAQYPNSIVYYDSSSNLRSPSAPLIMNRDFVSAHELMNVPFSSPGQILQDFTPSAPPIGGGGFRFNHLLDFDMDTNSPNATNTIKMKSAAALFDFVGTRNPWVDADKLLDPADTVVPSAINNSSAPLNDQILNAAMLVYRPPFNRLSQFVEPGKINMNTASEERVLRGLMYSAITPANNRLGGTIPYQAQLTQLSRIGLGQSSALSSEPHPFLNQSLATQFPAVFRPGTAATSLNRLALPPIRLSNPSNQAASTGLLRQVIGGNQRLFDAQALFPNLPAGLTPPYNPLMTNYPVTRLTNLTTSNSNLYAVRIVLGYFEFSPATGLGREYGEDEGQVRRHKGFYVIDRSIPVGYEPGKDHNAKDCILLQRFVE